MLYYLEYQFEIQSEICRALCLVRWVHFKALCQSAQKASLLLFHVPRRVFPALLRWTCSPPPGSDGLEVSSAAPSVGMSPVCQTFTLLLLKRFFQNFTSSEEFSWSVGKASFNIEIPFYLYCTFYYLICAFDNFTLFSFLHYNRN